jgi:D-ornithine 4,5-aminomutase subunit beta
MGFGRNSHGIDVATFLAQERQRRRGEVPHGFRPEDLNPKED